MANSSDLEDLGCLLRLLLILALIVIPFLGLDTHRKIYFGLLGYPSAPTGNYVLLNVISSSTEKRTFGGKSIVVEVERPLYSQEVTASNEAEFPQTGTTYALECKPRFWNLCSGLTPGHQYFGRWVSSERKQLAVTETITKEGKEYMADEKTRIFEVRSWKNRDQ